MKAADLVIVTFQYKVIALRKSNGEKLWETDLVKRFIKPADAFIALVLDEDAVSIVVADNASGRCGESTGCSDGEGIWR
jgi:outer membrane protein assembly factor BamB